MSQLLTTMHEGKTTLLSALILDENPRPLSEATIQRIQDSIGELGLLAPLVVYEDDNDLLHLCAGFHRYEAMKRAGIKSTPYVRVPQAMKEYASLCENVCREDLDASQKASMLKKMIGWLKSVGKREKTLSEKRAEAVSQRKDRQATSAPGAVVNEDVADVVTNIRREGGVSDRTAQRLVRIASNVPQVEKLSGTALSGKRELEAVASLPPAARKPIVEAAIGGAPKLNVHQMIADAKAASTTANRPFIERERTARKIAKSLEEASELFIRLGREVDQVPFDEERDQALLQAMAEISLRMKRIASSLKNIQEKFS